MKRVGCIALHYGKEYLAWAVKSLACAVDEIHVFYQAVPSYGYQDRSMHCPDTEKELVKQARRFLSASKLSPDQLIWHRLTGMTSESQHRDRMLEIARGRGAQLMIVVDADEIWDPGSLCRACDAVEEANRAGRWLARFHNFWRSWRWTVKDDFRPVRIVDFRHPITEDAYLTEDMQPLPVYHFGYAQSEVTMRYKMSCHGHKAEFRPGWLEQKFLSWRNAPADDAVHQDLHPVVNKLWTAEPTNGETLQILSALMPDHPYRKLSSIR